MPEYLVYYCLIHLISVFGSFSTDCLLEHSNDLEHAWPPYLSCDVLPTGRFGMSECTYSLSVCHPDSLHMQLQSRCRTLWPHLSGSDAIQKLVDLARPQAVPVH